MGVHEKFDSVSRIINKNNIQSWFAQQRDALVFYLEFSKKQLSHGREMANLCSCIDMKKR